MNNEAYRFLKEQDAVCGSDIDIEDITDTSQIPQDWKKRTALIWGIAEEITAMDFLKRAPEVNPEYQEYLRLKEKYEGKQ